jgi:hypothetical protein
MGLDLRWPIGLMFSIIGVLLVLTGLVKGSEASIDLKWGLVLVAFGAFMLIMAVRGGKSAATRSGHSEGPKR